MHKVDPADYRSTNRRSFSQGLNDRTTQIEPIIFGFNKMLTFSALSKNNSWLQQSVSLSNTRPKSKQQKVDINIKDVATKTTIVTCICRQVFEFRVN